MTTVFWHPGTRSAGTDPEPSDADLIAAVRAGDAAAFDPLYRRHSAAARSLAHQLTRSAADVDDLVAEAFAKVLDTLRAGGGPDAAFRAYLLTVLRNTLYDRVRRDRRLELSDDLTRHDPGVPFVDPVLAGLETTMVAQAYARLPERWRAVLWHTEVEGETPAQVAPILGLTPNGVSALAYRAREGLRQAYLQVHLADGGAERCRQTVDRLGAWARGGLAKRDKARVDEHLAACETCRTLSTELTEVNGSLRGILAPVVLGAPWAAGYLASAAGGGAAAGGAVAGGAAASGAVGGLGGFVHGLLRAPKGQIAAATGAAAATATAVGLVLLPGEDLPSRAVEPRPSVELSTAPAGQAPAGTRPAPAPTAAATAATRTGPGGGAVPGPGRQSAAAAPGRPDPTGAVTAAPPGTGAPVPPPDAGGTDVAAPFAAGSAEPIRQNNPGRILISVDNPADRPTGEVTAVIDLPAGVVMHANGASPGHGWRCREVAGGASCVGAAIPAGGTVELELKIKAAKDAESGRVSGTITADTGSAELQPFELTVEPS